MNDAAPIEDHHIVREFFHVAEVMARQQDRAASSREIGHERVEPKQSVGVESVAGFVEDQDARIAKERDRQTQALPHAERQSSDHSVSNG
ncbi:hypothetical protein ASG05_09150 [Frigoribacterium sp. Leaf186]|nr:hypothetical protein ASG05_09150 [Frigoribacterium sp. Leaf186]